MSTTQEKPIIEDFHESEWEKREVTGGKYLYLKDDLTSIDIRIIGRPYKWFEVNKDKDGKPFKKWNFALKVIYRNMEAGGEPKNEVRGFKAGATVYDQLYKLHQDPKWGNLSGYDVTISRTGSGLKTEYSVSPDPNKRELTEEEKQLVMDSDIDLKEMYGDSDPYEAGDN